MLIGSQPLANLSHRWTDGLAADPIDLNTVLFASIILRICVDDTIHLLVHFQEAKAAGCETEEAIEKSLKSGGKAILITSLLLMGGMGIYAFFGPLKLASFWCADDGECSRSSAV